MAVVSELIEMNFVCRAEVLESGQVIIGDEPEKLLGTDKGPNPFAFLQMSLAN